ncbi:hypothetical protein BDC45DRAFT_573297 [Circinella umbellata]|nr:hypothetical protein BDC45DRAFT_573297 [Circinella umbellata]
MTWAQIRQNKRVSLMHNSIQQQQYKLNESHNSTSNEWTTIFSHVWKVTNSPHSSVFIDISSRTEDKLTDVQKVGLEFPNSKTRIIDSRGMPDKGVIRKLRLSHLPLVRDRPFLDSKDIID